MAEKLIGQNYIPPDHVAKVTGRAWCCNRRLAEKLRAHARLQLEGAGPVQSGRLLRKPSRHHTPALCGDRSRQLVMQLSSHFQPFENGAAGLNASTGEDATQYYYSLPANRLELWFNLEAQRFLRPVFREFYKERDVVREERRMRIESSPQGKLVEGLAATAFLAHPYRHPAAGWASDWPRTAPRGSSLARCRTLSPPPGGGGPRQLRGSRPRPSFSCACCWRSPPVASRSWSCWPRVVPIDRRGPRGTPWARFFRAGWRTRRPWPRPCNSQVWSTGTEPPRTPPEVEGSRGCVVMTTIISICAGHPCCTPVLTSRVTRPPTAYDFARREPPLLC